ncbi:MAG: iron ABC transporter permease [Spirochaetaceae bacterium]|jgi:iron complex transport system permease protein|nr:iron ABC transporter permease [Spirochaetaceae bacterium]
MTEPRAYPPPERRPGRSAGSGAEHSAAGRTAAGKFAAVLLFSLTVFACGVFLGRSPIGLFSGNPQALSILVTLRIPRAFLAFMVGGALALSGAVFQAALKNPLASPYILGISSGASLGAALVMTLGLGFAGGFTLPAAGFVFGLGTVFLVVAVSSRLDKSLSNNTIILFGMVFSLFVNAVLTTMLSLFREELRNLVIWQLGSFSLKGWNYVRLMLPFLVVGFAGVYRYAKELDILSFGEEEARAMGVQARRVRKRLFFFSSLLTGAAVALTGAVGFVDLIAPHAARKIIGSNHRLVLPFSFFTGGALMTAADLAARTIISPSELPVGAVTALIGAPFFAWIYFRKK